MLNMKFSILFGAPNSRGGQDWKDTVDFVVGAEKLGIDSAWSAEAWGMDAVGPLAYIAAKTERIGLGTGIMQISARAPAVMATTALSLASMSDNRFMLGLGASGPYLRQPGGAPSRTPRPGGRKLFYRPGAGTNDSSAIEPSV